MDYLDFTFLIKIVETSVKKSYHAYEHDGKLINNVSNFGAKTGDVVKLERRGEYYGISVEFMEDVQPLLTDKFVIRILSMLNKEDYITPLSILKLNSIDQLTYILHTWFTNATTEYDNSIKISKKYPNFDKWINTVTHDPLLGKIKVVEIGFNQNTGNSVVPEDWIGREFNDGYHLQSEMDKLETRIGKPPVTYAIIYSMIIQKQDSLITDIKNIDYDSIYYLDWNSQNNTFYSELTTKSRKKYQYVKYNKILIGFKLDDILEPKSKSENETSQSRIKEVGLLVSRLQKAIRRGRYGSKALIETIDALNVSPNYNLPEHGFLRVSSSKQMVWRLFITILEDCRSYTPVNELGLLDLVLLVLITQKNQEYKFKKHVLNLIKLTALLAQYNDTTDDLYDWRSQPISKETCLVKGNDFHNALSLAIDNIIMMAGDKKMLSQYYSEKNLFEPFSIPNQLETSVWEKTVSSGKCIYHDEKIYEDIILSSYDMHVKTNIILYYQACIPISITTKQISGYIWDVSSSYNVRSGKKKPKNDKILRSIQNYYLTESTFKKKKGKYKIPSIKTLKIDNHVKRTSFLLIFGKKYRTGGREVVLAGTKSTPARVKNGSDWKYSNDLRVLDAYPHGTINLNGIDPPFGFKWIKKKVSTKIKDGKPYIDNVMIPFFDGSSMIESITPRINKRVNKSVYGYIVDIFSGSDIDFSMILYFRKKSLGEIVDWIPYEKDMKKIDINIVKLTYAKIFNQFNNIIMIGPVDRLGNRMQNSINYLSEGKLWAVFNLFTYLYPDTFQFSGSLNFTIKKETSGFIHLINTLESILFVNKKINGNVPLIKTELWDHQKESVDKIVAGFRNGRHGFGDASDVGSGKTLTSLKISVELIKENNQTHSGILVLLPGNKLIETWKTELEKHTEGFDIKYQKNNPKIGSINRNTIVVTTMARMRDHPINHNWLLVVIDECLTVQNKNAFWTQEAWIQSLMSKYLIMMSATFFRTRFDKLYYMLKMLNTGLPEKREYLDTILLESIVSQISKIKRKWTSTFHRFKLDSKSRKKYEAINKTDLGAEAKYSKLSSLLVSDSDVKKTQVKQLEKLVEEKENQKRRCLIYAYSKEEAEYWSNNLNIGIYPEKGKHCIITYHDGTYGLNDLVIYDTIVMRPPQPDKLPQIKGRLDRPGNKKDHLYIEYFVLKNTIEEGLILRMNIASQFIQRYIMPLAKFYEISINYQKYREDDEE